MTGPGGTPEGTGLCAVVLNYCAAGQTIDCVRALRRSKRPFDAVIVVDNASPDGSAERIAQALPDVILHRSERNTGYAGGMNQGFRRALEGGWPYVLILNGDTIVEPDAPGLLADALEQDPGAAVAAGTITYADAPGRIWYAGGDIVVWRGTAVSRTRMPDDAGRTLPVTFCSGCACMFRAAAIAETGGFDERFFMYCEDVELGARLLRRDARLLYVPSALCRHHVSHEGDNPFVIYFGVRNRLLFLRLGSRGVRRLAGSAYVLAVSLGKYLFWSMTRPARARAVRMGLADYLRGRFHAGRAFELRQTAGAAP